MSHSHPKYVQLQTVSQYLSVSNRTVRRLIERGDLRGIKITSQAIRVDWQSVLDFESRKLMECDNE